MYRQSVVTTTAACANPHAAEAVLMTLRLRHDDPETTEMDFRIRSYRRFSMQCPVFYLCEKFIAQGTVWNFSRKGWRVDGEHDVPVGAVLALCVFLPDQQVPMTIERAIVRWSRGQEFGLETLYMQPEQNSRFKCFVKDLVRDVLQ